MPWTFQTRFSPRTVQPFFTSVLYRTHVTHISPTTSLLRSSETDNEIYLIGTAHVSESSAQEIAESVRIIRPHKIFLELDPERAARLVQENRDFFEDGMQDAFRPFAQGLPPMKLFGNPTEDWLSNLFRAFYRFLRRYGFLPGIDMLSAIKAGREHRAELYYGDIDAKETLQGLRTAFHPSLFLKMMSTPIPDVIQDIMKQAVTGRWSKFGETVEQIKTRDHCRAIVNYMDRATPQVAQILIHRRDKAMAQNLREHCNKGKIVAVVGMAHMDGVEREWMKLRKPLLPP